MLFFDENQIKIAHRIKENTDLLAKLLDAQVKRTKECQQWHIQADDQQNIRKSGLRK